MATATIAGRKIPWGPGTFNVGKVASPIMIGRSVTGDSALILHLIASPFLGDHCSPSPPSSPSPPPSPPSPPRDHEQLLLALRSPLLSLCICFTSHPLKTSTYSLPLTLSSPSFLPPFPPPLSLQASFFGLSDIAPLRSLSSPDALAPFEVLIGSDSYSPPSPDFPQLPMRSSLNL